MAGTSVAMYPKHRKQTKHIGTSDENDTQKDKTMTTIQAKQRVQTTQNIPTQENAPAKKTVQSQETAQSQQTPQKTQQSSTFAPQRQEKVKAQNLIKAENKKPQNSTVREVKISPPPAPPQIRKTQGHKEQCIKQKGLAITKNITLKPGFPKIPFAPATRRDFLQPKGPKAGLYLEIKF